MKVIGRSSREGPSRMQEGIMAMQQGFGIILLADEIVRERRAAAQAAGRVPFVAREPKGKAVHCRGRRRRLAVRVPRFVVALTVTPARRRVAAE